jgi:RNA polymerase sigma factor (sigma-70 family)
VEQGRGAADSPLPYVRAAVLNACRSVLRRQGIARRAGVLHRASSPDQTLASAESEVILSEERREVLAALARLPQRRREVLVLRYYLGLSEAEIAAILGISPGTVKSTAARALATLARDLGESS